jgi:hypothetical protein
MQGREMFFPILAETSGRGKIAGLAKSLSAALRFNPPCWITTPLPKFGLNRLRWEAEISFEKHLTG